MFKPSSLIREDSEFSASLSALGEQIKSDLPLPIVVGGLAGGARSAYLVEAVIDAVSLAKKNGRFTPLLVLLPTAEMRDEVCSLLVGHGLNAYAYKMRMPVLYNISASRELDRERLLVLSLVADSRCDVVVTTPDALVSYTMPKDVLTASSLNVAVGDEISPVSVVEKLSAMGFRSVDSVEDKGQYSRRGGIIDFWCSATDLPTRVEFFGDEIDRMVSFDPITQRAEGTVSEVSILPSEEMIVSKEARVRIASKIEELIKNKSLSEEIRAKLLRELAEAKGDIPLSFRDKYMHLIYDRCETLLDYIDGKKIFFVLGTAEVMESLLKHERRMKDEIAGLVSYGAIPKLTE